MRFEQLRSEHAWRRQIVDLMLAEYKREDNLDHIYPETYLFLDRGMDVEMLMIDNTNKLYGFARIENTTVEAAIAAAQLTVVSTGNFLEN